MRYHFERTIVIALGGSLIHPDEIDVHALRAWNKLIRKHAKGGRKFVLVIGGGQLSRRFQKAAHAVHPVADEDKDWLGIHATRLNAHLVRTILRDVANPVIIDARGKVKKLTHAVTVASGWQPGWSTDFISAALAQDLKVPEFVIVGKPAYVYDKDNSKYPDAKPLRQLSWREYRKLIPAKWRPGLHAPVDPVAARLGQKEGLKAIVVGGKDIRNFERLLNGQDFEGTIIE